MLYKFASQFYRETTIETSKFSNRKIWIFILYNTEKCSSVPLRIGTATL